MKKVKNKYIGKLYEGKWIVIDKIKIDKTQSYILFNTFTGEELEVSKSGLEKLDKGLTNIFTIKKVRYKFEICWRREYGKFRYF